MPYEKVMAKMQREELAEDMHPDCWFRIQLVGTELRLLVSRDGDVWTPRATFEAGGGDFDITVPVILPLPEYKEPQPKPMWYFGGKKDEEDIS